MRARRRRSIGLLLAALATVGAAGCSTAPTTETIPVGQARASECARLDLALNDCSEYVGGVAPTKEGILAGDRQRAGQMNCELLDVAEIRELVGGAEVTRTVTRSGSCRYTVHTPPGQRQLEVRVGSWPEAMDGYRIVPGNQRTEVAGRPAWLSDGGPDANGNRSVSWTISTTRSPYDGGVMFAEMESYLPRGQFGPSEGAPLPLPAAFEQHQRFAERVITAYEEVGT
ncbi:hypothetical protein [Saccharopolyspora griseoalba]|uniref:DUF3558 domain-containing protein n=1 Tax=Saccharopolyspora griseoalba TaxID=1431848 RepID=A0ABW2LPU2_9PSEU